MHQAAEADCAGKISWTDSQDRNDDLDLAVSRREEGQALLPTHDRGPIALDLGEVSHEPSALRRLALQKSNLLGVLANAQKSSTKIRLATLLLDIEIDQWPSYPMRDGSACYRIDDGRLLDLCAYFVLLLLADAWGADELKFTHRTL